MKTRHWFHSSDGVSPIVGVILMVAVTVILSAVVSMFVFNLGSSLNDPAESIGVTFDESPTGVTVQLVSSTGTDVHVQYHGDTVQTLSTAGENALVPAAANEQITVIADGTVVATHTVSQSPLTHFDFKNGRDGFTNTSGNVATLTTSQTTGGRQVLDQACTASNHDYQRLFSATETLVTPGTVQVGVRAPAVDSWDHEEFVVQIQDDTGWVNVTTSTQIKHEQSGATETWPDLSCSSWPSSFTDEYNQTHVETVSVTGNVTGVRLITTLNQASQDERLTVDYVYVIPR